MKRIVCAVIVILAFLTANVISKKECNLDVQYIRTDQISSMKEIEYSSVMVVNSIQQLQEYYSYNYEYFAFTINHDNIISFKDAIKKYDDDFFSKGMLAIVLLEEGSGSVRHQVTSVERSTDKIDINIKRKSTKIGTDDMAQWHIIIELNKADIPEVTEFSVNVT